MPKWNEMQEKAIYTENKNILVSASAGSGKTTVLIARLLHLIKDKKIDITKILAMTFTEAAANEMKKRMAEKLNEALKTESSESEKVYLQSQLANLSNASISTIHGFCLDIIQHYYYTIGLDSERVNTIMDDTLTTSLLNKSMDITFHHFIEDETFYQINTIFSSRAHDYEALKENILTLFYLAQANSNPYTFLKSCKMKEVSSFHDYPAQVKFYFIDYLTFICDSILESLTACEYICNDLNEVEKEEKIKEKKEKLINAKQYLIESNYAEFRIHFLNTALLVLPNLKDHDIYAQLKKDIDTFEAKLVENLYEEETFVLRTNKNKNLINYFIEIVSFFMQTYEKEKESNKCIDFSDMEHFALQILEANNHLVASLYRDKFEEIMVDEFQDSNDVQDHLVSLIARDRNVFRVGDIKQSIYGFRHASPSIMQGLIQNSSENDEVIYLNNNYRSKESIVEFNNVLFDILMNVDGYSSSFSEHDNTIVGLDSQKEDNVPAVFSCINAKDVNEYTSKKMSNDELKADYISSKIIELINNGKYHYKDFVILIKTHAKAEFLRDAFDKYHIPYFISMKHGFYDSSALQNVLSFLKALYNPNDDISLLGTLTSRFFNVSDSTLANAKIHKDTQESYYQYFTNTHLLDAFNELKKEVNNIPLSTLLSKIYNWNDYYTNFTTIQEKSNLDKLYEMICEKEKKDSYTLDTFISSLNENNDTQIGEAIPIGNNDDVVRVMTIHQSKGLQFKVVFLYSTNSISLQDIKGIATYDDTLKISFPFVDPYYRYTYPTLERIAFEHKKSKEALEEEIRLLYVATTRAQHEMYLVDCVKDQILNPISKAELYKKKGFTNWILQTYNNLHKTELYRKEEIHTLWNSVPLEEEQVIKKEMKQYDKNYHMIHTSSPSESEITSFTPSKFSLDDSSAQRGTQLHYMVEILPDNMDWTYDSIINTAHINNIELTIHDVSILQTLNQNTLFKDSKKDATIYHEFPFIVNSNSEIIHGFMDYVAIQDNNVIMIDFKSDHNVNETTLIKRYEKQIQAYHEALTIIYSDKTIETYIYSFELGKMIRIP